MMISIIIPCRNGVNYLAEAVAGIQRQNVSVEISVVDDGSTDDTAKLAASLGCKVISIPHSGLSAALNVGLKAARGEYILFHDHDDVLIEGALARLRVALENDPASLAVLARLVDFVSPELDDGIKRTLLPKTEPYHGLITGAALFRRGIFAMIGCFDESLETVPGSAFLALAQEKDIKIKKIDFVSAKRRLHDANMGRTMPMREKEEQASLVRAMLARRLRKKTM
jgi:glycosyltransferase involved in cell wall biosynthesis